MALHENGTKAAKTNGTKAAKTNGTKAAKTNGTKQKQSSSKSAATGQKQSNGRSDETQQNQSASGSILWIPAIFVSASAALYVISKNVPLHPSGDDSPLKFPSSLDDLHAISKYLKIYQADHNGYVFLLFCFAYIYKQTFAVPGSVFLNILAGALFGTLYGFPLACFLCASGATCCFLLSRTFGKGLLTHYFPDRVKMFENKIEENSDSLFFYLLFLRLFPMSPNWFMNMVAPIIGVPIQRFFLSVFIGLMPYNFICVRTGVMLSDIKSLDEVFTIYSMIHLLGLAVVALVPGIIIKRIHDSRVKAKKTE